MLIQRYRSTLTWWSRTCVQQKMNHHYLVQLTTNANPKIRFFWRCNLLNSIFFKSLPWKHHCVIVARKARSIAVYPGCDVCNNCHGIHLWCRNWRIFVVFRKSRFWRILIVKNQMHVKCQSFPNNAKSWIPIWIIGIFLISSLKLFGLKSWKLCGSI